MAVVSGEKCKLLSLSLCCALKLFASSLALSLSPRHSVFRHPVCVLLPYYKRPCFTYVQNTMKFFFRVYRVIYIEQRMSLNMYVSIKSGNTVAAITHQKIKLENLAVLLKDANWM